MLAIGLYLITKSDIRSSTFFNFGQICDFFSAVRNIPLEIDCLTISVMMVSTELILSIIYRRIGSREQVLFVKNDKTFLMPSFDVDRNSEN